MTESRHWSEGTTLIQFRAGDLAPRIARHDTGAGLSLTARELIDHHLTLLDLELERIDLSVGEWGLLCEIGNGTFWTADTVTMLALSAEDADPELGEKWDIDLPRLLTTLRGWSPGQFFAAVDAIRRFWAASNEDGTYEAQFRQLGMMR